MKKEYKEIVIKYLYGWMEGTIGGLEKGFYRYFKIKFGIEPDYFTAKFIRDNQTMSLKVYGRLMMDGHEYEFTRDLGEEENEYNRLGIDDGNDDDGFDVREEIRFNRRNKFITEL